MSFLGNPNLSLPNGLNLWDSLLKTLTSLQKVISKLSDLKGVLLARIMEDNTNRMKLESISDEEWDFEHQQICGFIRFFVDDN
ncbi:hypothetical protein CR513_60221, partial [Mucuna pruriens]